jgi:hypothetical protein
MSPPEFKPSTQSSKLGDQGFNNGADSWNRNRLVVLNNELAVRRDFGRKRSNLIVGHSGDE